MKTLSRNQYYKRLLSILTLVAVTVFLSGARLTWPATGQAKPVFSEKPNLPAPPPAVAEVKNLSQTFVTLAEELSPAVVNIYTKQGAAPRRRVFSQNPFSEEDAERGFLFGAPFDIPRMPIEALGSGFVINAEQGYIVTNAHVVRQSGRNVDEIMIKFIGEDNSKGHAATVVGVDEPSDVALLKLVDKIPNLKVAALGDSAKSKVGEWVLAIGNPYGHTHSVTQGIVSALGRNLEGARSEFLQTSASINPGNSGGPLINMNGEVIGMNSAIDPRAQNIGFAVPVSTVKDVVAQLVQGGHVKRAWMGIGIADVNEDVAGLLKLKDAEGVLVKQVVANAPAAKAGVETYDVIRKINGTEVHNTHDLYRTIDKLSAGTGMELEVLRGGARKTLRVKLGEQPANS